jgi:hypothetical protein
LLLQMNLAQTGLINPQGTRRTPHGAAKDKTEAL